MLMFDENNQCALGEISSIDYDKSGFVAEETVFAFMPQ